jgi:hypothetical protein
MPEFMEGKRKLLLKKPTTANIDDLDDMSRLESAQPR